MAITRTLQSSIVCDGCGLGHAVLTVPPRRISSRHIRALSAEEGWTHPKGTGLDLCPNCSAVRGIYGPTGPTGA